MKRFAAQIAVVLAVLLSSFTAVYGQTGGTGISPLPVSRSANNTWTGTNAFATTTTASLNGVIVVDGAHYPKTGPGLQSAINTCLQLWPLCNEVDLANGTTTITAAITVALSGKSLTLKGNGLGSIIKNTGSTSSIVVTGDVPPSESTVGGGWFSLKDMTLIGNVSSSKGLYIDGVYNGSLQNLVVKGFTNPTGTNGTGIYLDETIDFQITNVIASQNYYAGLVFGHASNANQVIGGWFINNTNAGVAIVGDSNGINFSGTVFESNSIGLSAATTSNVAAPQDINCNGCWIENNSTYGVYSQAESMTFDGNTWFVLNHIDADLQYPAHHTSFNGTHFENFLGHEFTIGPNVSNTTFKDVYNIPVITDTGTSTLVTTARGNSNGTNEVFSTSSNSPGAFVGIEFNYASGHVNSNMAQILSQTASGGGGDLEFQTAGLGNAPYTTKMLLQKGGELLIPGGFVSIGTTTVNGTDNLYVMDRIGILSAASQKSLHVKNTQNTKPFDWYFGQVGETGSDADDALAFYSDYGGTKNTGNNLDRSLVTNTGNVLIPSGNVGVGTTTPWANLSVAGVAGGTLPLFAISSSTSAFATSSVFYIDRNGLVGIASSTPGSLLSIGNIANFTAATSTFYSTGGINLAAGCFAVGGNCLSLSTLSGTLAIAKGGTATTTMYAGGILFYDGTLNTVSQAGNGNGLFYDRTNNRLGVGAASPVSKFQVGVPTGGSTNYSSIANIYGADAGAGTPSGFTLMLTSTNAAATNVGPTLAFAGESGQGVTPYPFSEIRGAKDIAGTYAGYLSFLTTDSSSNIGQERMRIVSGGNVGVGTTTPVANFQVTNASANATTTIEVGKSGQSKGSCVKLYDATGVGWYYTPAVGTGALTAASASSCASVTGF